MTSGEYNSRRRKNFVASHDRCRTDQLIARPFDSGSTVLRDRDIEGTHMNAPYRIWGTNLEPEAVQQLKNACNLPVAVSGALMPDAHVGYGLPIGGVLGIIPGSMGGQATSSAEKARWSR